MHLLPQTQEINSYKWRISSEKNLKLGRVTHSYQANEMETAPKWVGEAEAQSLHKPHPGLRPTIQRELKSQSFSLRSEGFVPHIRLLRDKPPKHLALKNKRACA